METALRSAVFGLLLAAMPVAAPSPPAGEDVHEVRIFLFRFEPSRIEIPAGGTVRWSNGDGIEHSATALPTEGEDGRPFDTGLFGKGEVREVTFTRAGVYPYVCKRHPSMSGVVVVR